MKQFITLYQNKKSLCVLKIKVAVFVLCFCCVFIFIGCQGYDEEPLYDENSKIIIGMDSILFKEKIVQMEYKEVWHFEPYSKKYCIEPDNWGNYGLEDIEKVARETGLDQVVLEEEEQVVFLQTYDFMVCDYIEVIFYTFTPDDIVKSHCLLLDRDRNVMGITPYELDFVMAAGQTYTDRLKEIVIELMDESVYIWGAITYAPRYKISDLNEDGYVDIYSSVGDMFLWDKGEYRLCSREEGIEVLNAIGEEEMQIKLQLEAFQSEHTNIINKENGRITYLQFYDIANAEEINAQIRDVIEMKDKEREKAFNISASDVIYVGERYLVVHMYTYTPGNHTARGDILCRDSRYLTFDLEKGALVSFGDILGENYTREDLVALMWKAYEKKINEVPDQYSKEEFDSYYEFVFEHYDVHSAVGSPVIEDYIKCYFTDEGMVVTYSDYITYGFGDMPVKYDLDERLDIIKEYETLELFCSWKEIYDEADG
ncbi:MAG: hypothetical protein J6C06_00375 [Lachnospiraceae bacterium]|nr:hypothetical protein [Lachnospiraceae bacterium]